MVRSDVGSRGMVRSDVGSRGMVRYNHVIKIIYIYIYVHTQIFLDIE